MASGTKGCSYNWGRLTALFGGSSPISGPAESNYQRESPSSQDFLISLFQDGTKVPMRVLMDTGSEVNIIRKGLCPPNLLRPSSYPVRFYTAS